MSIVHEPAAAGNSPPSDSRLRSARARALDTARALPHWPCACWHKSADAYLQYLLKRRRRGTARRATAEPRRRADEQIRAWRAEP